MTLSFEPMTRRTGRVVRGTAVDRAQPASLHIDSPRPDDPTRSRRVNVVDQLEAARQEAYDEGYAAGLSAARESVDAARAEALRRGVDALHQAATAIESGRANAIAVVEEDAAQLAVELTRTLVDHELSMSEDEVSATVRRALRLTASGEDLVVRLHPEEMLDAALLQPHVPDCRVSVVADPEVERGGCVIDAGPCRIDAQIEPALARVRWALLSASGSADVAGGSGPPARQRASGRGVPGSSQRAEAGE